MYSRLLKEFPESEYRDRALFYSGEAAYGLGEIERAVRLYTDVLSMKTAQDSPLRCDALYARGVALEELNQFDKAIATYRQLLKSCDDESMVTDVYLRLGDLQVARDDFNGAIESFEAAVNSTEEIEDRAYAMFRQAFALVQADRPADAAARYETLIQEFPDTEYAERAMLAAAQSLYRSGNLKEAGTRFEKVLERKNRTASTEAAHWLCRIALANNEPKKSSTDRITSNRSGARRRIWSRSTI